MKKIDAIDLTTLPKPQIIELIDPNTIVSELKRSVQESLPHYEFSASDPITKLLEVFAMREFMLRQRINESASQCLIAFATGDSLTNLASLFQVKREDKSDDELRVDVLSALDGPSTCGSIAGYKHHVDKAASKISLELKSGSFVSIDVVEDCNPYSHEAGKVVICVLFSPELYEKTSTLDLKIPDNMSRQEFLDKIRFDKMNDIRSSVDRIRPITDFVTYREPDFIDVIVNASIALPKGAGDENVQLESMNRLKYTLNKNRKIGKTLWLSSIISALHLPSVERVVLDSPKNDVHPFDGGISSDEEKKQKDYKVIRAMIGGVHIL